MESTIKPAVKHISKQKIKNEYYALTPHIIKENKLRLIEPYEFKYQLYTKGRWVKSKLLYVLENEFKNFRHDYFIKAITDGKILINNEKVDVDYVLKRNDFITHLTIRKENPIIDQQLQILYDDKDYIVVNKPSSWPVHVCGGYQFNTLQRILIDEYNYKDIKVLHRLDKHTSGVVLFAKNKNAAERFRQKLHTDSIQKIYFARVKGDFKHPKINVKRSIIFLNKSKGIYTDISDEQVEEYNQTKENEKLSKDGCKDNNDNDNDDEGERNEPKYAETNFEKLFYDDKSNTSVVICKPKTGRTHQIRIHLRYLGYPIANDPCYGGIIYNDLKEFNLPHMQKYQFETKIIEEEVAIPSNKNTIEEGEQTSNIKTIGDHIPTGKEDNISVSQIYCYKIWLHAWAYKFDLYSFETSIPPWAKKEHMIDIKF